MPVLQPIRARQNIPSVGFTGPGNALARGFEEVADTFARIQQEAQSQQDEIDVATRGSELDVTLDSLKEDIKEEPDFSKRVDLYRKKATEFFTESVKGTNPRVQARLQAYFPVRLSRALIDVNHETQRQWGEQRVADVNALGDLLSDKIISSKDPEDAALSYSLFKRSIRSLADGPAAPLTKIEAEKMERGFLGKVEGKRARALVLDAPATFLNVPRENFSNLTDDEFFKFRGLAQEAIEKQDKNAHKLTEDVGKIALSFWAEKANRGELTEGDFLAIEASPYVKDKLRSLKEANDSPVFEGSGLSNPVGVVMLKYSQGPSSLTRIQKARDSLNYLVLNGNKSEAIKKALTKLQTDERTMQSIGATDLQRKLSNAEKDLRLQQGAPIFRGTYGNILKNMSSLEVGELRERIKNGEEQKKIIDDIMARKKARVEATPKATKKILDAVDED